MSPRTSAGPADALGGLISSLISRLNLVELLAHRHAGTGQVMPTGTVLDYAGSSAPGGYVLCDGATYDGTLSAYADLFAVIGLTYGGSGSNFQVPDLRGRVSAGRDATQTEFDVLGETGGAKTVTLTGAESGVPAHSHPNTATSAAADISHTHSGTTDAETQTATQGLAGGSTSGFQTSLALNAAVASTANLQAHSHTITTGGMSANATTHLHTITVTNANNTAAAAAAAHQNLQPYLVVNKIIRL